MSLRINVTGNAGSGKTSFARRLGVELGLAVFSLDSVVWQPGWVKTPSEQRALAERELASLPSWIIDGVSTYVRGEADLVVFSDVPRHIRSEALRDPSRFCVATHPVEFATLIGELARHNV